MAVHNLAPSPQVPQVVPFTPEAKPQIHQFQLERFIHLRNQAAVLKSQLEAAETELKAALENGVPVEPGTHACSLKESFRPTIAWRDVAVRLAERLWPRRGSAYCENVLQNTKPSRTVALIVS